MKHRIEVLGPGCTRCHETFRVVQHVIEQTGEAAEFELVKEESMDRMIELGVLSTPAIVLDGRVVLSGVIPKAEQVRQLLQAG